MPNYQQNLKAIIKRANGEGFWKKVTVTSSDVKSATKLAITQAATGDLAITQIIGMTDSTGLAGGTNFVIGSTNPKGTANIAVETVANLGANVTKSFGNPPAGDTTTGDGGYTVTSLITVLQAGQNLWVQTTATNGTGAGTIDLYIRFERVATNADIVGPSTV